MKVEQNLTSLALQFIEGELYLLDQQQLPQKEVRLHIKTLDEMVQGIKSLAVRGAPAIGVAAALFLGKLCAQGKTFDELKKAARVLNAARPTAVNLMWAMDRLILKTEEKDFSPEELINNAFAIFHEDVLLCEKMGNLGASLINDGESLLTHCNTGGLATAGIGTALGVIRKAWEAGKKIHVYVDETRPLLQGGRLTAWECEKLGIPYTLICDNMAAFLMAQGKIQRVFVGSDRVAANGDFANKIGTYNIAVLAKYHNIPFHGVAPYSTIDAACATGADIPIEQRDGKEVRGVRDYLWAPEKAPTYNPSFDITPVELVTSFVFNHGIFNQGQLQQAKHLHTGL